MKTTRDKIRRLRVNKLVQEPGLGTVETKEGRGYSLAFCLVNASVACLSKVHFRNSKSEVIQEPSSTLLRI